MRYYGTITRWNDNRQFGAIREENMGTEVFAPLSAFTTLTRPPAEGQRVSFDIVKGRRGRDEAENICFSLDCVDEFDFFDTEPEPYKKTFSKLLLIIPIIALLAAGGWFGWDYWQKYQQQAQAAAAAPPKTMVEEVAAKIKAEREEWLDAVNSRGRTNAKHKSTDTQKSDHSSVSSTSKNEFKCDGRQYCSQMTSLSEAEFFVKFCPNTKMDGDHDGIPCENDSRWH